METTPFTQPQRESLINLLALGMYADSHLSLKEDDALHTALESIGWESGIGRTAFLEDAITRASRADTDEKLADYLKTLLSSFNSAQSKKTAVESLTRFLAIDGTAESELPFLAKVRQSVGL